MGKKTEAGGAKTVENLWKTWERVMRRREETCFGFC